MWEGWGGGWVRTLEGGHLQRTLYLETLPCSRRESSAYPILTSTEGPLRGCLSEVDDCKGAWESDSSQKSRTWELDVSCLEAEQRVCCDWPLLNVLGQEMCGHLPRPGVGEVRQSWFFSSKSVQKYWETPHSKQVTFLSR